MASAALLGAWLATVAGCDPWASTGGPNGKGPVKPPAYAKALVASPGPDPGVVGLSWNGTPTGRVLGVLRGDGRVDVYSPGETLDPTTTARDATAKATTLAILGGGKCVTGDSAGLVAWSLDPAGCRRLGRLDCGAVERLIPASGDVDEGYAGLRDGSVLRFRVTLGEDSLRVMSEYRGGKKDGVSVASLALVESGKAVAASWSDGRSARLRRDLGEATSGGSAATLTEVVDGQVRARLLPGPSVIVEDVVGRDPPRRLGLGRRVTSLAIAGGGKSLVVGGEGQFLLIDLARRGPIAPDSPRVIPAAPGPSLVAGDPDGTGGRVALADASGRVELLDAEALAARSVLRPTDEVPELAFAPGKRLGKPRFIIPGAAAEPRLPDPTAAAGGDLAHPEALELLRLAAEEFARTGRGDREADVRRWRARALIPDFDGPESPRDAARIRDGIDELARAAALYESAKPPLFRQARICDAERAWALLTLGEVRAAEAALRPAVEFAATDPVLDQSPELDLIAGSSLAVRGDWAAAGDRFGRVLVRLYEGDRDGLRRRALLARIGCLTAQIRLREAADLGDRDGGDVEVRLRGLTARIRVGLPLDPTMIAGPKDAHIRGRIDAAEGRYVDADGALAEAIDDHRMAGRTELAVEGTLERAEALELRNVFREAQKLYESVVRSPTSDDRSEVAFRPTGLAVPRAFRGLARCLLAQGRPEAALTAVDQAALSAWMAESGEAAVRSSPMALPSDSAGGLAALRKARAEAGPDDRKVREQEAKLAVEGRLIAPGDPTAAFDPAVLRLAAGEAAIVFVNLGPDSVVAFLVRRDRPVEARRLPLSRGELRRAIASWRGALGDGGRGMLAIEDRPGLGPLTTLSAEPTPIEPVASDLRPIGPTWDGFLDDALVRPFVPRLGEIQRLIVVPTPEIAALPLEAVGRSSRLLSRLRVSYLPALSVLQARRADDRLALGAGAETLWFSSPEAAGSISNPGPSTLEVSGQDARPSRLFGPALADCGLIRLSAPATLDPRKTPRGQPDLRLAPEARTPWFDGRLTATDLLRLPIRARLLILDIGDPSARDAIGGGGIVSLARDGLAAGAEAVLIGLWDVPASSSAAFFAEVRAGLADGKSSPADALDRARRALARDPKTRDPVHWAGFVLYGAP